MMKPWKSDIIAFCVRLFVLVAFFAVNTSYSLSENTTFSVSALSFISSSQQKISRNEARRLIINEDFAGAIKIYSRLLAGDSLNMSLIVENSYALALSGYIEGALMRLDRLWILGQSADRDAIPLINHTLLLTGSENLVRFLGSDKIKVKEPSWLSGRSITLLEKYRQTKPAVLLGSGNTEKDLFLKANILVINKEYFQAVYIFDYLTSIKPDNIAYRMGYITALENIGSIDAARGMLKDLVSKLKTDNSDGSTVGSNTKVDNKTKVGGNTEVGNRTKVDSNTKVDNSTKIGGNTEVSSNTKVDNSTIEILENHLKHLDKPQSLFGMNLFQFSKPQTMVYLGMMIAPSYYNVSGKLGYFISEGYNASFDISLNKIADVQTMNTGVTMYQRKNKFIYGMGLTYSAGQAKNLLYKISVGYSIPNKKRTSSFDFFCDINCGFTKDVPVMMGLSVGKSFYFGKRK